MARDGSHHTWPRATGLAEDVRRYGQWCATSRANALDIYTQGRSTRQVTCHSDRVDLGTHRHLSQPGCGIAMPLTSKWLLGKKKNKEAYVVPSVVDGQVSFAIGHDLAGAPTSETDGTVNRNGAVCIGCGAAVEFKYIRAEGRAGRMGQQLMATVAAGSRTRTYLAPTSEDERCAEIAKPVDVPEGSIFNNPRNFNTIVYGLTEFADLFTSRQLTALTTFGDLVWRGPPTDTERCPGRWDA